MDTPVQLSVRDVLAVSSEVSGYLHEQTRKRRIPIDTATAPVIPTAAVTEVQINRADAGHLKKLYACPSPRAKVTLLLLLE